MRNALISGLYNIEGTVQALVDIIHACISCDFSCIPLATKLYYVLLLCDDTVISFAAKGALLRVLRPRQKKRKVTMPTRVRCSPLPGMPVRVILLLWVLR